MCLSQQQKILKIPYPYLIFQLEQIKILGQADTCFFSPKNGLSIPNIWQKKEFLSIPPKIIFALSSLHGRLDRPDRLDGGKEEKVIGEKGIGEKGKRKRGK